MSTNYLLADMITKIRNGQKARLREIQHKQSRLCQHVLEVLIQEGVLSKYKQISNCLYIELGYQKNEPLITQISCVSRPSRRIYIGVKHLWDIEKDLGFSILSTSQGILSDKEARRLNVGGELLCKVF